MDTEFLNTIEGKAERLSKLHSELQTARNNSRATSEANADKLYYSQTEHKMVGRLLEAIAFVESDEEFLIDFKDMSGLFFIHDMYHVSPQTRKWRHKGNRHWFPYKNPEQFIKQCITEGGK